MYRAILKTGIFCGAVKTYYDEGAFIPFEPVTIPKGSHAIITILDKLVKNSPANM
ncbi:MAG: antitoxin family protein [Defluviitaleaceae bacterium]|nr:antitoxin family protein [Defluviitaleaceae bacterium]